MADTVNWYGASGRGYTYYAIDTGLQSKPGNYVFAKRSQSGGWIPVYIGQTEDLESRLSGHEKLPCVKRNGGTHIHAHISSADAKVRRAEEADLLAKHDPPCNKE